MKKKKKCSICKKEEAVAWFHGDRVCQDCWEKIKKGYIYFKADG